MSPQPKSNVDRCIAHAERLARVEERLDTIDAILKELDARYHKAVSSRMDRLKFAITLFVTFMGTGTGLFLLGRILGSH
jgi:hypothetical protein